MIKIGINGFGRIGRLVLRASLNNPHLQVVAINDLIDSDYLAYIFKHDSTHGLLLNTIDFDDQSITVDGNRIRVTKEKDPKKLDWASVGVDYVVESTGLFLTKETASKHLKAGAKKVILSAPSKDETPMFVYGVNHQSYSPDMDIVSNASCTTNCLAPIVKVIEDNYGISSALMSTVHSVTSTQNPVDGVSQKNWRLGRSAYQNIIPSSTGAAKALGKIIPNLDGKITGMAFRVPVANVSVVDLSINLNQDVTYSELCDRVLKASQNELKGVLAYTNEDCVSSDFVTNAHTCIFDAQSGIQITDRFVKIVAWYDNEWGYSNKILDLLSHMHKVDSV